MPGKYGSHYGGKGVAGAYGMSGGKADYSVEGAASKGGGGKVAYGGGPRNPLKGRSMPRGPKDPPPSHRGNRGG